MIRRLRRIAIGLLLILLVVYVSSYLLLSRRGFADADRWKFEGFYFFTPEDSDEWRRWNYGMVRLYYPLIVIDNLIGTGREPAHEPLWRMS